MLSEAQKSFCVWTFGVFMPVVYSSLLPVLSLVRFPTGTPFAKPDPPLFASVSYYICEVGSAGAFACICAPSITFMWMVVRDIGRNLQTYSLLLLMISWFFMIAIPHTEFEVVHGVFTGMVMTSGGLFAYACARAEADEKTKRRVQVLLSVQIACYIALGMTRMAVNFGRDVGYTFFIFEVIFLLVSSSVAPVKMRKISLPE